MSRLPKVNKPRYNKDDKFAWVDSQWEKFMDRQKELELRIEELEIENTDLKEKLMTLFPDEETKWIYESPNVDNQINLFDK